VLAHVTGLARAMGAHVTLLRLLDQPRGKSRFVDPVDWNIRKIEAEVNLNKIGESIQKPGVNVSVSLLDSRTAEHVLNYAQSNEVDLIVLAKATESVSDLVHSLMKRTTIPLMVAPSEANALDCYRQILVPLDGSQRAEYTLPLAVSIADKCDAQIVLAHVVHKPEMPRRAPPSSEEVQLSERIVDSNRSEAIRYLEQIASRLSVPVETRVLVSNSVTAALHELAEQEDVDLIILSAHGYSGTPQWPYGSITNSLMAYSRKPLLVVQDLPAVEAAQAEAVARSGKAR
jgi:nucleotide-binding universal stress UspA family protein